MKKIQLRSLLLISIIIGCIVSSCSEKETTENTLSLNFSMNGISQEVKSNPSAQYLRGTKTMIIRGAFGNNASINFNLMNCDTPGTYVATLLTNSPSTAYCYIEDGANIYESDYCRVGEKVQIVVSDLSSNRINAAFEGSIRSTDSVLLNLSGNFNLDIRP